MPHLVARFRVRTLTLPIAIVSLSLMAYGTPTAAAAQKTVPSTPVIIGQPLSPPKVPQLAVFVAEDLGFFENGVAP
jgi:hypothetical protein